MRILFLTSRFPTDSNHFTLEKELVWAFCKNGHDCTVASLVEKKYNITTNISTLYPDPKKTRCKVDLLQIKSGNLFNDVSFLEKKLTILSLPFVVPRVIKKHLNKSSFDLIIAYGPYLCSKSIIKPLKEHFQCRTMLMQWDIFPQNAYDLGIIKNKYLFKYFLYNQAKTLAEYDLIACNSQGNIDYFNKHFAKQTENKLILFHNCEQGFAEKQHLDQSQIIAIRQKYGLDPHAIVLLFGGNIGIPQELENITNIANSFAPSDNIQIVISGRGTEANKIKQLCANKKHLKFIDFLPSKEYENLLKASTMGIVSLSSKFTVPNFPAKVTSYLKLGIPVFASLDNAAYNDLGDFIKKHNIGFAIKTDDIKNQQDYIKTVLNTLVSNNNQNLIQLQQNSIAVFNEFFNIDNTLASLEQQIINLLA